MKGWRCSLLKPDPLDWRFGAWINRSSFGTDVWLCIGPLVVSIWKRGAK